MNVKSGGTMEKLKYWEEKLEVIVEKINEIVEVLNGK